MNNCKESVHASRQKYSYCLCPTTIRLLKCTLTSESERNGSFILVGHTDNVSLFLHVVWFKRTKRNILCHSAADYLVFVCFCFVLVSHINGLKGKGESTAVAYDAFMCSLKALIVVK